MNLRHLKISPPLLTLILIVLGIIIMVIFLIVQVGNWNEMQQRAQQEEEALRMAEIQLSQLLEIRRRAPEYERHMEALERLMPHEAEEDYLIASLERRADDAGVNFIEVQFEERLGAEGYGEIPLQLHFEGDYHSLIHMLQFIQYPREGDRAFRVEGIRLGPGHLEVEARAFYRDHHPEEEVEPGVEPEPDEVPDEVLEDI